MILEDIDPRNIAKYLDYFLSTKFNYKNYTVGRHMIYSDHEKEIVLNVWSDRPSDFHSHPVGGCMFKVLKGTLDEERDGVMNHYSKGQGAFLNCSHKVYPGKDCVTLHYYSFIKSL